MPLSNSCVFIRRRLYVQYSLFFFFQAEDGIRDIGVTGVQTCALPICVASIVPQSNTVFVGGYFDNIGGQPRRNIAAVETESGGALPGYLNVNGVVREIGRASCRERV